MLDEPDFGQGPETEEARKERLRKEAEAFKEDQLRRKRDQSFEDALNRFPAHRR